MLLRQRLQELRARHGELDMLLPSDLDPRSNVVLPPQDDALGRAPSRHGSRLTAGGTPAATAVSARAEYALRLETLIP